MVPCQCVKVEEACRESVIAALDKLRIGEHVMKRDPRPVAPLSYDERESGFFQFFVQFDNYAGDSIVQVNGHQYNFQDLGLGMMPHEDGVNCTAQHVPVGSLLVYPHDTNATCASSRTSVSTLDVAPSIMRYFGIDKRPYMQGSASIALGSQ
jgi:hypothetical protein